MNLVDFSQEAEFLKTIYEESGRQIRANEQLLTGYLVVTGAVLASLIALPAVNAEARGVWVVAALASAMGFVMSVTSAYFVRRAVSRQRTVARTLLSSRMYQAIAPDSHPRVARAVQIFRTYAWLTIFGVVLVFSFIAIVSGVPDWMQSSGGG